MKIKNIKIDFLIYLWFIFLLLIPFSGHRYSNDSTSKYESAYAFITTGSFDVSESEFGWGRNNSDGKVYTYFTFGSVLLMLPPALGVKLLHLISGKIISQKIVSLFITFQNLIFTALIGVLLFKLFRLYNISNKDSFIYANIVILGSQFLQYSSTGWSEPGAFLFSLVAFYLINKDSGKWILWAIFIGLTILIRIEFLIYGFTFLVISIIYDKIEIRMISKIVLVIFSILCLQLIFNYIRYESFLDFGYFSFSKHAASKAGYALSPFSRYLRSIFYSYMSFGRLHIFWVSPLILLNILLPFHWHKLPSKIKVAYMSSIVTLIIIPFAGYNSWCWGNRYLFLYFPYLLIALFFIKDISRLFYFKMLLIISLFVNFLSTFVNSHVVQEILSNKYGASESIEISAKNFIYATFWVHLKLFPNQLINTLKLLMSATNDKSWEWHRINCLDIWPVGLSVLIRNTYIPFILWVILIIITIIYYKKVIRNIILR